MLDIWSWMSELPNSDEWPESDSPQVFELASYTPGGDGPTRAVQLRADRTAGSNTEAMVSFSLYLEGFHPFTASKALWVSDTCPLASPKPFLPLVLQLLDETITRSPVGQTSTCPRSNLQRVNPDPVSWIMDSHSPESFSVFFDMVFLTRLFWLCVFDAPSEVGSLFFESLLGPNIELLSCRHAPVLRTFLVTIGADAELCFMRTAGYMLTKWLILREVQAQAHSQLGGGLRTILPLVGQQLGFSYATEAHGLWALKGFAPILGMKVTSTKDINSPIVDARESVLKYALGHHQLEAVIQLEYSVEFFDGYVQVTARVDNLRFHVARLGFSQDGRGGGYGEERHFVSRARVWVGPEVGATYVSGLSLGRSTENMQREVELQRSVKGNVSTERLKAGNNNRVKTRAGMTTKSRIKSWRWDQDAEGNAAIFEAVLYDNVSGNEVAAWCPNPDDDRPGGRFGGFNRPFATTGGMVFAGDEYGDGVGWRLSKEMEGSVLKWRIGGRVWVSYWPNQVKSSYFETRCVEWCDEVDLPLIPGKLVN